MIGRVGRKNSLDAIEEQVFEDYVKRRKKRKRYDPKDRTRVAAQVRKGNRLPPPVPKNKSLKEIEEMDPQDMSLRHGRKGRPRIYVKEGTDNEPKVPQEELTFAQLVRADQQRRTNHRRARVRRWEARVVKAQEVLETHTKSKDHAIDVYDEERAIAEGILDLEDWDNEELIRGYRRGRQGKFGPAPKYIPREIQQEAFRRLVHRGNRKLREAYMKTIEGLIDLAHNGESEKVRLEAVKELLNRIVGKVPDIVVGAQMEQPWESILGDSLIPFGEDPGNTIDMDVGDDGVARMDPIVVDVPGALSADDESGSGTGRPTPSVARVSGTKPKRKPSKKTPADSRQTTVAKKSSTAKKKRSS